MSVAGGDCDKTNNSKLEAEKYFTMEKVHRNEKHEKHLRSFVVLSDLIFETINLPKRMARHGRHACQWCNSNFQCRNRLFLAQTPWAE